MHESSWEAHQELSSGKVHHNPLFPADYPQFPQKEISQLTRLREQKMWRAFDSENLPPRRQSHTEYAFQNFAQDQVHMNCIELYVHLYINENLMKE